MKLTASRNQLGRIAPSRNGCTMPDSKTSPRREQMIHVARQTVARPSAKSARSVLPKFVGIEVRPDIASKQELQFVLKTGVTKTLFWQLLRLVGKFCAARPFFQIPAPLHKLASCPQQKRRAIRGCWSFGRFARRTVPDTPSARSP